MSGNRVLVVDDEALNLLLIQEFLSESQLSLDVFSDPLEAWAALQSGAMPYDLVILDRMMPGLDGLDILRRLKQEARYLDVPVIMQTAASSPDQVKEGLEAGAYYYLTKPYEPEALVSIVRGALEDYCNRQELRQRTMRLADSKRLLLRAEYRFRSLDDIVTLVPLLAGLCPSPETAAPGLSDLLVNAVEHGNLGISYEEKSRLKWDGNWEEELRLRLTQEEYKDRVAHVCVERLESPARLSFTITDQGAGFDWQKFLDFDPERAFDPNGRGIAMARLMSFASLEYRGRGNIVCACVHLDAPE